MVIMRYGNKLHRNKKEINGYETLKTLYAADIHCGWSFYLIGRGKVIFYWEASKIKASKIKNTLNVFLPVYSKV